MSNEGTTKNQHIHNTENLQRKAIRITNLNSKYAPSKPLFIGSKIIPRHCQVRKLFIDTTSNKQNIAIKLTEPVQNY